MIVVPRHSIPYLPGDLTCVPRELELIPRLLEKVSTKPALLASLLDRAWLALARGPECGHTPADLGRWIRLGGEAGVGLFAVAGQRPAQVVLEGQVYSLPGLGPGGEANASRWLDAFFLAALSNRHDPLIGTTLELITAARVEVDPWLPAWIETLQILAAGRDPRPQARLVQELCCAPLRNSQPDAVAIGAAGAGVAIALWTGESMAAAFGNLLRAHAARWSVPEQVRADRGWISHSALGLAALARQRGQEVEVDSGYLPLACLEIAG